MPEQWTKAEVVSELLKRLGLPESKQAWQPEKLTEAVMRLLFVIEAAGTEGLPLCRPDLALIHQGIRLYECGETHIYPLIKTIEAHVDAYRAAESTLARTRALFSSELARSTA